MIGWVYLDIRAMDPTATPTTAYQYASPLKGSALFVFLWSRERWHEEISNPVYADMLYERTREEKYG